MTNNTAPRLDQALDAQLMRVTPKLAEQWLGRNDSNRNIRPTKLAQLVRDMQGGRFALTGDSIKFDLNGNLIDGQHRLTAVRDSGIPIEVLVVRGLVPSVRAVIDTGATRSASDALRIAGKHAGSRSMAAAIRILLAIRSGEVAHAGDIAPPVTHSEVITFYDQWAQLLDYCVAFANRNSRSINIRPAALAAAMFVGAQHDLSAFTAFITRMTELDFGDDGDPARSLYKRLKLLRDERHMPSDEMYYVLRAFELSTQGKPARGFKAYTQHGPCSLPAWPWVAPAVVLKAA